MRTQAAFNLNVMTLLAVDGGHSQRVSQAADTTLWNSVDRLQ